MLLKNIRLVLSDTIQENITLGIEEGIITKGDKRDDVIDCSNLVAVPSFFNAHTHAGMHALRGQGEDMELHDWLENKIWPLEDKMSKEDVYESSKESIKEMLASGTTAFNDMYGYADETARAAEEMKIRGFVGVGIVDNSNLYDTIEETKRFVRKWKDNKFITPVVAPHAIYTCSEEILMKAKEIAEKNTTMIHLHLSETRKEVYDCWKERKMRPVEYLDDIGFLGENVIAAHCGWLTKNEIRILAKRGVKIAHCPVSNMKLAVGGEMPLPELQKTNLIGLGTDGPASSNSLSMFDSMKFAALLHKHKRWDPTITRAQDIFNMATTNGFKIFGLDNTIKTGNIADLVLLDKNKLKPFNKESLVNHIVYSIDSSAVVKTICNGKLVYDKIA